MKKELATVVCLSAILSVSSLAFAGAYGDKPQAEEVPAPVAVAPAPVEPEPVTSYWYAQAGANFFAENFDHGNYDNYDNAWGYNVRVGRRFCDWFSLEAEWEHAASRYDNRANGDVKAWDLTANGKVTPVTGHFQPFLLVGVGYQQADLPHDDNMGFVARFGAGLDVLITDSVGVAAEVDYLLGTGEVSHFDQIPVSLGVFYNFL